MKNINVLVLGSITSPNSSFGPELESQLQTKRHWLKQIVQAVNTFVALGHLQQIYEVLWSASECKRLKAAKLLPCTLRKPGL